MECVRLKFGAIQKFVFISTSEYTYELKVTFLVGAQRPLYKTKASKKVPHHHVRQTLSM